MAVAANCRLGICRAPQSGLSCTLQNQGDDEPCGAPLEYNLHPPRVCRAGAGLLRCHSAVVVVPMNTFHEHRPSSRMAPVASMNATGVFAALEAAIPELYPVDDASGVVHERFMDLVVCGLAVAGGPCLT